MGLQRSSQAVALCGAVLLGGLQTVETLALCAAELLGGLQTVGSFVLHTSKLLGGLKIIGFSEEQSADLSQVEGTSQKGTGKQ